MCRSRRRQQHRKSPSDVFAVDESKHAFKLLLTMQPIPHGVISGTIHSRLIGGDDTRVKTFGEKPGLILSRLIRLY